MRRTAGICHLLVALPGGFAELAVRESLRVPGDAPGTPRGRPGDASGDGRQHRRQRRPVPARVPGRSGDGGQLLSATFSTVVTLPTAVAGFWMIGYLPFAGVPKPTEATAVA